MTTAILDTAAWVKQCFESCELGDVRRNRRLMKLATQLTDRPDGSFPDQTETWGDCKAAYRFFDEPDVSFQAIIEPHCRQTREGCEPGAVKLIINDTTEYDYTSLHTAKGLGPIGNGHCRGFFVHSALLLDDHSHRIEGLAAQEVFYRKLRKGSQGAKAHRNSVRRRADRESAVWGRVIDRVGRPPEGVTWIHLCDRGADDIEVMWRALHNGCGFVIRAARLKRKIITPNERNLPLNEYLAELPTHGTREVSVLPTAKAPARAATVTLRYGETRIPLGPVLTPWLKEHRPTEPLRAGVVELRETHPPKGVKPIHWVLYTETPIESLAQANAAIARYEQRPQIEDFHKAVKTGCAVEYRQLKTAARLERAAALSSVVAVRLMQLKTAAKETPERPARELVPLRWIELLRIMRKLSPNPEMSIRDFMRQLAGLGGFLGRKGDGEPGWITIWRGFEKFRLILRGADAQQKRCG